MVNDRIQVLNISNVNALGKTVLNDGKLLELIQKYPFLYNSRVRAYNDPEYATWAWKCINAAFNRSYANDPNAAFSTSELIERWNTLKPLIQCLSKAYDLDAIPENLRTSVVKICTELEDQTYNALIRPYSLTQNLLSKNMSAIDHLPMEKKLELEKHMLDFILSSELDSKHAVKLDAADWKEIQNNTDEFLNTIGFKQVLLTSVSHREKIFYSNYSNPSIFQYSIKKYYSKSSRSLGWLPLNHAHKYVKPCKVRVDRINIEDYLPLSKIMQITKSKNKDRESPGIFGV